MSLKIKSLLSPALAVMLAVLMLAIAAPAFADALDDARAAGLIGERPDGLVGAVNPNAPANIQSLVQSTNAKRLAKYQQIGNEKGVPPEQVGALAAEKIIGNLKPGWYYMDASGNWVQR